MCAVTRPEVGRANVLKVGALQFLSFAARGFVVPFASLYLASQGFSAGQIGLLLSLNALVQLLVSPVLSASADRSGRHGGLYRRLIVGNAAALLAFTAPLNPWWLGGMLVLRDLSDLAGAALLSQLTIAWLARRGLDAFGRIRMWGSLGWAVATLVSGTLFAAGGYPLLFLTAAGISLSTLPLSRALPARIVDRSQVRPTARGRSFYLLLGCLLLYYVGVSTVNAFSPLYFQKGLGADTGTVGLLMSIAAIGELPAMLLIDAVLRRWGTRAGLVVGTVGLAGLWVGYTLLSGPALLVPLMLLRGTFFTLQSVSVTLLVSQVSHPGNAATNQAIMQVTLPAVATLLTGSVAGHVFDLYGGRTLFQVAAALALVSAVLIVLLRKRLTHYAPDVTAEPLAATGL